MKKIFSTLIILLCASNAWAGGSGGGVSTGGTRPTPNNFSVNALKKDWVKFNNVDGRKVEFYFKDRANLNSGLYKVDVNEIDARVVEALQRSELNKSWQAIQAGESEQK